MGAGFDIGAGRHRGVGIGERRNHSRAGGRRYRGDIHRGVVGGGDVQISAGIDGRAVCDVGGDVADDVADHDRSAERGGAAERAREHRVRRRLRPGRGDEDVAAGGDIGMTGDGDIRRRARCDIAAVDAEGQPLNGLADEREIPGNRTHHARDGRRGRADADVAGGDRTVDRDAGRRIGVAGHQGLARRGRQRHIAARIRGSAGIDRLRKDLRAVIDIDRRSHRSRH